MYAPHFENQEPRHTPHFFLKQGFLTFHVPTDGYRDIRKFQKRYAQCLEFVTSFLRCLSMEPKIGKQNV